MHPAAVSFAIWYLSSGLAVVVVQWGGARQRNELRSPGRVGGAVVFPHVRRGRKASDHGRRDPVQGTMRPS